ncbi:MAG: hypothetical protein WAU69_11030 [Solirubrobacteraceae bacterium]
MSAPYLEEMEAAFRSGAKDLHEAAAVVGISFDSACLTFNNGLRKGYWRIELPLQTLPDATGYSGDDL